MKLGIVISLLATTGVLVLRAQSTPVPQTTLLNLPGERVQEAVLSSNANFIYYDTRDALKVYDRARKRTTVLLDRSLGCLALSSKGDLLAFCSAEDGGRFHIVTLALDPITGLSKGSPRRASMEAGDTPSISPDGKWIAFAGYDNEAHSKKEKQRIAVIPAAGGPERVLSRHDGEIDPIRWSMDGLTIAYGVAIPGAAQRTFRIAAAGGTPTPIHESLDSYPGRSPDGRLLVLGMTDKEIGVFDAAGRLLGTFPSQDNRYAHVWSGESRILSVVSESPTVLRAYSLATGMIKRVAAMSGMLQEPRWSPDGKRIAVVHGTGRTTEVLISNPDGSNSHACQVPGSFAGMQWSPDGQKLLHFEDDPTGVVPVTAIGIGTVDVATCRYSSIARGAMGPPAWTSDSKAILVAARVDSANDPGGKYRIQMHRYGLGGDDKVLAEARSNGPPFVALSDTTAMLGDTPSGDVIFALDGSSRQTTWFAPGERHSFPAFSLDRKWVALRSGPSGNFNTLDVMRTNGSERATIPLPFTAQHGLGNPVFLPNNREVIVIGSSQSADSLSYYRVNVTTKAVTRILTVKRSNQRLGNRFTVSPDGSTLLFVSQDSPQSSIVELDLAAFLKSTPR